MSKKIDYGRPAEQYRPGGVQYTPPVEPQLADYGRALRKGGGIDTRWIGVVAGCVFLLVAFIALFFCLKSLWEGVFGSLDPAKAAAGFGGSALVAFVAGWAGWRFVFKG